MNELLSRRPIFDEIPFSRALVAEAEPKRILATRQKPATTMQQAAATREGLVFVRVSTILACLFEKAPSSVLPSGFIASPHHLPREQRRIQRLARLSVYGANGIEIPREPCRRGPYIEPRGHGDTRQDYDQGDPATHPNGRNERPSPTPDKVQPELQEEVTSSVNQA